MGKNIESFQEQKESLFRELEGIGNFRRGTISFRYRKCGKSNCICATEKRAGHAQYQWSTTIKGKSINKNLKLGSELQKYSEEIDNYHKFQHICEEIIQANEKICNLLPVCEIEDSVELHELKKKLQKKFMKKYKKKLTG
jgi:hypothetical protein